MAEASGVAGVGAALSTSSAGMLGNGASARFESVLFTVWKIGCLAASFSPASKDREDKRKMTTSRKPQTSGSASVL